MRILHTSDWHIGKRLRNKNRYEEFDLFLSWLAEIIEQNEIDALLVAGDIFDTTTPSNRSQELYYQFLQKVSTSSCRHIVIIAGNHDSPSFLNAPRELLKILNVHVIGNATEDIKEEVLVLNDKQNVPELIVCAVPYLRDRDVRSVEVGENIEDRERKLIEGIRKHYSEVGVLAEQKRNKLKADIPIVGMGHLFTVGGRRAEDDGVRELYVGTLGCIPADTFPQCFDYMALGHLHAPQTVAGSNTIRYSGSPLQMGFGDSNQERSVYQVNISKTGIEVESISVPEFQKIKSIKGTWDNISNRLTELSSINENVWLEIIYDGAEIISDLQERVNEVVQDTQLEVLQVKNKLFMEQTLAQSHIGEELEDLDEIEVFERCLAKHGVQEDEKEDLMNAYKEILLSMKEDDVQAE